jgi:hypothetical protein
MNNTVVRSDCARDAPVPRPTTTTVKVPTLTALPTMDNPLLPISSQRSNHGFKLVGGAALGAFESPGSTRTGGLDWEDWIQQRRHDSWAMSVQVHRCDSGKKSAGPLELEDWCTHWAIGNIVVDVGVSHLSDRRPQLVFGCRARGLSDPIIVGTILIASNQRSHSHRRHGCHHHPMTESGPI